ncbi:MAG: hypothetical protein D6695_09200 [Planctomycetota bacterium]|nr:MAG: hypothetical protein D6695_09200 [Planctomycetota bacterium]
MSLLPVIALAGCGYERALATRNVLGGSTTLATLTGRASDDIPVDDSPSTHSIMRAEWQPIDVLVPVDGTVHGPTWRIDARADGPSPRQKSLHPTLRSALALASNKRVQVWEGVLAPFVGLANVAAMPVLMLKDPPASYMSPSRTTLYKRSRPGRTVAGTIPAQDDSDVGTQAVEDADHDP